MNSAAALDDRLREILLGEGLRVIVADDAAAASRSGEGRPDLILLDARAPASDAPGACARIRAASGGATPLLALLPAHAGQAVAQLLAAGADDVLVEPLHLPLLIARARHLLRAGRQTRALQESEARAEALLQEREEYLRALVEHSAEIIAVLEADGAIRYVSPGMMRLLGYPDDMAVGHFAAFAHPDDLPHVEALFAELIATPGGRLTVELRVRHHDGSWPIFEVRAANLLDNPVVRGIVVNSHDITARKQIEAQLTHDAFHDTLTELPNRALFHDRLGQALERSARLPGDQVAVLLLDLDRFKRVNESLGLQAGDQLIVAVARRLERCARPGDTVARLGGDEFAILVEAPAALHEATLIAERIAAAFQQPIPLAGQELVTSASVGITVGGPGARPDDVLRDADIAMYGAKSSGPGRYRVSDASMHAEIMARLQLEAELRRAIERDELVLHYQPKMTMDGRAMRGVEALVRWEHPTRGLISPAEFIPLAEETGLIIPLGVWVLRAACRQARRWRDAGLPNLYITVNLSGQQFKQPGIAATIQQILAAEGLDPEWLSVELTESILMEDAKATVAALRELRAIGLHSLAIDDFGTGYSSLSYLQRFPITTIKIDRSFVRDLTTNASNAALVRAIIALADSLGLETVAEGVETEEQRAFLEGAGCDRFQGFLVSRPLPAEGLERFLQARLPAGPGAGGAQR